MTEQEAKENINNIVYGFLDEGNNIIIEELTLVSISYKQGNLTVFSC